MNGQLYTALIWSARIFALQPAGGYLCYFKFATFKHSNYIFNYDKDIHLKDIIWRYYGERENSENSVPVKIPVIQYLE